MGGRREGEAEAAQEVEKVLRPLGLSQSRRGREGEGRRAGWGWGVGGWFSFVGGGWGGGSWRRSLRTLIAMSVMMSLGGAVLP